ncbi:MAG: DUF222 domain-containing protein, partial [Marmoricola sp.]|nr:DUF222 domain-containing protein [Marmoricola sp.]
MESTTLDAEVLLCAAEANVRARRRADFEQLRIARDWALANPPDPDQLSRNPLCAGAVDASELPVLQFVEAELAAALEIHPLAALRLMGDAVDLDRRLPQVWAALADGRLEAWVARKIAAATRALDHDAAGRVDAQVADLLGTLPPGRLLHVVDARVKEADQELADQTAAREKTRRGVWRGRDDTHGTGSIFARGESAGMNRFYGTVDHLAHLLREHCPELAGESMDELRGRAFVLLG